MAAFAVREDARKHGRYAVDGAAQIDTDNPIPVRIAGHFRWPDNGDACVVAEDVNLPESCFGSVGSFSKLRAVGDVEFQGQNAFRRAQLCLGLFQMIVADVSNDDIHAGAKQGLCDAEADAGGAARDDCCLAG